MDHIYTMVHWYILNIEKKKKYDVHTVYQKTPTLFVEEIAFYNKLNK